MRPMLVFALCVGVTLGHPAGDKEVEGSIEKNQSSTNSTNPYPGCICVTYYICSPDRTLNYNGVGIIDKRSVPEQSETGLVDIFIECEDYFEVCCKLPNIIPPDNSLIPIPTTLPAPAPINAVTQPQGTKCGILNQDSVNKTGAGIQDALYGEFPWMIAVLSEENQYLCGGSLIHPEVVLTAAHCVDGIDILVIRAGEWTTDNEDELYPRQERRVHKVVIHEQFNSGSLSNDPALLILESPVDVDTFVGLVCLPDPQENMDGRDCVVSGWGKNAFGTEGKYSRILRRVDVPIVPRSTCVEALRETRLGKYFHLRDSFICAGGTPGFDTCKGDGGSPLVCPSRNNPGVYVQAGIVAWGIDCGTETPGVYVNVPLFINWIHNKLHARGFSIEF